MEKLAEYQPVLGEVRSTYIHVGDPITGHAVERIVVWDGERWVDMQSADYHRLMMRLIAESKPRDR